MKSISLKKFIEENTPEGMEYDSENSTPENIVFKEKAKGTRWESLGKIGGYYLTSNSDLFNASDLPTTPDNKNLYATEAQCKAHLAQAQLSQIKKKANEGWVADWTNATQAKWCIYLYNDAYHIGSFSLAHQFLAFKSEELAEQVLRENKDLLEQYKPLAG